jgi:hypothetical protein
MEMRMPDPRSSRGMLGLKEYYFKKEEAGNEGERA